MGKMIESGLEFHSIYIYDISDQRLIRTDNRLCQINILYYCQLFSLLRLKFELSDIICTNY